MTPHFPLPGGQTPEEDPLWIIQAQYYYLDQFCLWSGLEPDSAVPLVFTLTPDRFAEARLTLPGAKCTSPEAWIKVLALLYVHSVSFKIYQATGTEDDISSLTLIEPCIARELEEILGMAAGKKVLELRRSKELLDRAFFLLEDMAGPL